MAQGGEERDKQGLLCYTCIMDYDLTSVPSLISHIHTLSAEFTNSRLAEKGNFVSSHGFILYLLSRKGRMKMGEIARVINRNKSTTTVLIKKLREEGLIKEENDENDSRMKYISLTPKGKKYNTLTASISRELLETCYRGFSQAEKEELLRLLIKLNENIEKRESQDTKGTGNE